MLVEILSALTQALEESPLLALGSSIIWGMLSILLSPCHLASIPLIVGFIGAQGNITNRRAFSISALFALGILFTIGLIGVLTAALGRMLGDIGGIGNYLVAAIFFLVGLYLWGVLPMPWSSPGQANFQKRGLLAALTLGLIFGVALGPCTFAYMAPMLGITFRLAESDLLYGILLLLAYGVGHCSVIVAAGTSARLVQHYLYWSEKSRGPELVKRVCGLLVILGGIWMILTARP